ncbi:MAG: FIST C-terminal domain-containing protein [Thermomicrobiales bacterium]|nr:FIST C-terminal domain-containing protein [Thermomicrobiales bacterium]
MTSGTPFARAALTNDSDWRDSLDRALTPLAGAVPDAVVVFASHHHADRYAEILRETARRLPAPVIIGCSGDGIVGLDRELERQPALALLALSLPGAKLAAIHLTTRTFAEEDWAARIGIDPADVNGWLILADPFRLDGDAMVDAFSAAYPGAKVVGGFASPSPSDRRTWLFLNGEIYHDGAVALAIGGPYDLLPIVSQGCDPIGEPWTITGVQAHWIETISNRPAVQILAETLNALPDEIRARAQRNLLVGLAADEYRSEFLRGDFLIRNIIGLDQESGAIAVGTLPRIGQTIQFQMRDAATADLDLSLHLEQGRLRLNRRTPVAGLLFTCNGRGASLFGQPHHDALAVARKLGGLPLTGLFCAGEFGPVAGRNAVHGFTASLALIVPMA